jgi:predicted short-subunit dehydrogenase-like oxidoreductase (DUF2520 family)
LAALLDGAAGLWQEMGFGRREAMAAIYPLARATLENLARHPESVGASVTGPVVRGDVATVQAHLEALSRRQPELVPVYAALTRASLPMAEERGVRPEAISALKATVDLYDGHSKNDQGRLKPCGG